MRRLRKQQQKEERFLARQARLRERRQRKNSNPSSRLDADHPPGDGYPGGSRFVTAAPAGSFPTRER